MSGLARGTWKQINRDVERILLDYPREESSATHTEWQFAWAIRELRRQLGEAQKALAQKEYVDTLGSDGPQVGERLP
jgi:hypothetical protein